MLATAYTHSKTCNLVIAFEYTDRDCNHMVESTIRDSDVEPQNLIYTICCFYYVNMSIIQFIRS